MEHEGAFLGAGIILGARIILIPSGGYMSVHIHKILQAVQSRIMLFTVYILSQHLKKNPYLYI